MSFLSRRSSRAEKRDRSASDAGRRHEDREYDDDYEYAQDDDNWSPDEYFSPEGIKGRWAAGRHTGPPAGHRDPGRSEAGRGYDGYDAGPQAGRGPRTPPGYGRDSYPEPYQQQDDGYDAEEEAGERGAGRKRRGNGERADRPERRRPRLGRRDRDADIWPDDEVSDEDYWASVAADRPLPSTGPSTGPGAVPGAAADATQVMGPKAGAAPGRPAPAGYPGNESRAGRLGPPPGLSSGPYPSPGRNSGPMARPGTTPGTGIPGTGHPASGHTQPSFQPSDSRFDSTERFDRVDRPREPAAYADPRRGQDRRPSEQRPSEPRPPEYRAPEHRPPEYRTGGRHSVGRAGADDDPLTSKAYSREAMAAEDTRSYRAAAAARRPPVPTDRYEAALSEQTQTFTMNGQYPSDPQATTARYPARGQQPQAPQRPQAPQYGAPGSRAAGDRGPSYPYPEQQQPYPARQAPDRDEDGPHGRPGAGRHAGNGYGGQGNARRGNGRY